MGVTPITTAREVVRVIHPDIPADLDWDKVSERGASHSATLFRTRGRGPKIPLAGDTEVKNITTEAALRLPEMAGFKAALKSGQKFYDATVVVSQFDVDGVEVGKEEWFGCMVADYTFSATDANATDGEPSKVIVEWAVKS